MKSESAGYGVLRSESTGREGSTNARPLSQLQEEKDTVSPGPREEAKRMPKRINKTGPSSKVHPISRNKAVNEVDSKRALVGLGTIMGHRFITIEDGREKLSACFAVAFKTANLITV